MPNCSLCRLSEYCAMKHSTDAAVIEHSHRRSSASAGQRSRLAADCQRSHLTVRPLRRSDDGVTSRGSVFRLLLLLLLLLSGVDSAPESWSHVRSLWSTCSRLHGLFSGRAARKNTAVSIQTKNNPELASIPLSLGDVGT